MILKEIARYCARTCGSDDPRDVAEFAVHLTLKTMLDELVGTGRCLVPGFGTIRVKYKEARPVKNPGTGESVDSRPKFKGYVRLQASVQEELLRRRHCTADGGEDADGGQEG